MGDLGRRACRGHKAEIHKRTKDAIAIITTPIRSVAVAMLTATGLASATRTIKTPRRIRITAERKTDFLVSRFMLIVVLERHTAAEPQLDRARGGPF